MTSYFISLFLDFIFSPIGLIAIAVGAVLIHTATRHRASAWLLLSLCGFVTSLGKFESEFMVTPSLVFPLEQLRAMGRPLAIAVIGVILVVSLRQRRQNTLPLPQPARYLIAVQAAIFFKTVLYGSVSFALLAGLVYSMLILMLYTGPLSWLQDEENLHLAIWSIAMIGVIFTIANGYQAMFSIYPLTFVAGRFVGTTGNPQQAGTLLAGILPCVAYMVEHHQRWNWLRFFWIFTFGALLGLLLISGSRTGLLMTIAAFLLFYRANIWKFVRIAIPIALILWIGVGFLNSHDTIGQNILTTVNNRLFVDIGTQLQTGNSRQPVWTALWNSFLRNPLFGSSLGGERLMGYGESSWLGTAAAVGLVGLVPLLLFGGYSLRMIGDLLGISYRSSAYRLQANVVVAGLTALLIASIFEALLLGNLTYYILMLLIYLAMGQYLVKTCNSKQLEQQSQINPQYERRWGKSISGVEA